MTGGAREGEDLEALPVSEDSLELVRRGMERCVLSGTGSRTVRGFRPELEALNGELAKQGQGLRVRCFGKTGTATRVEGRECAAFVFYLQLEDAKGKAVKALSVAIYLEDRGTGANSGNAVELAGQVMGDLGEWLVSR